MSVDMKEVEAITRALAGDFHKVAPGSMNEDFLRLMVYECLLEGRKALRRMPYREFREIRQKP